MKTIDYSPLRGEDGSMSLPDRLRGIWQYDLSWYRDLKAQEAFITHLGKHLGNDFFLVRSLTWPGFGLPIPLVLVGPAGIQVISASALKGVYRLKQHNWALLDDRSRRYKLTRPNPVARLLIMTEAIAEHLAALQIPQENVNPVFYLFQPGIHVDAEDPAVRLVRPDAVDHFIASLLQKEPVLEEHQIEQIVEALSRPPEGEPLPQKPKYFSLGSLRLLYWKWLLLGIMAFMAICILAVTIAIIFTNL